MITYANKTQDKKTAATTESLARPMGSAAVAQFKNNRPEAVAQRRLQAAADTSLQVKQLRAIQHLVSSRLSHPIQAKADGKAIAAAKGSKVIQAKLVTQLNNTGIRTGRSARPTVQPDLHTPLLPPLPAEASEPEDELYDVSFDNEQQDIAPQSAQPLLDLDDRSKPSRKGLRPDAGKMKWSEIGQYGILGSGVASAGAGKFSTMVSSADAAGVASDYLGAISGGLGAVTDTISLGKNVSAATDSSNNSYSKRLAKLDAGSSAASAVKSGAASAVSFLNKGSAGAATATSLAGGAGLAMGAFDIGSGLYGIKLANQRRAALERNRYSGDSTLDRASSVGIASQKRERIKGIGKVGKGAVAIGGSLALLLGATPVGWALLSAAAVVGGAAAAYAYYKKRKDKKQMAIDILGVGEERARWKARKKATQKWYRYRRSATLKAEIGEDPLEVALRKYNYSDPGHCYNNFVDAASKLLYHEGVLGGDTECVALINNLGLRVTRKGEPSAKKIAAKLST